MATMSLSLPAIYNYELNVSQRDIFSGLTVPALLDRSTLIDLLLLRSAPFECVYTHPDYLEAAITNWSAVHQRTFTKWAEALNIDYEPLNNYDRTEESTDTEIGGNNRTRKTVNDTTETDVVTSGEDESGTRSDSMSGRGSSITGSDNVVTGQVSAYDSASWNDADKSITNNSTVTGDENTESSTGSNTTTRSTYNNAVRADSANESEKENESRLTDRSHKLRAYGNIGVTTSQQMLQAELDVSAWNIYEHIADLFLDEFCVLLY